MTWETYRISQEPSLAELSTFCPYHNVDRRPEMIWEFVQPKHDGREAQRHLENLCSRQGKARKMLTD